MLVHGAVHVLGFLLKLDGMPSIFGWNIGE